MNTRRSLRVVNHFETFFDRDLQYELRALSSYCWTINPTHPQLLQNDPFLLAARGSLGDRDRLFSAHPYQHQRAWIHFDMTTVTVMTASVTCFTELGSISPLPPRHPHAGMSRLFLVRTTISPLTHRAYGHACSHHVVNQGVPKPEI